METVCNFISASALCKVNLKPVSGNGLSDIVSLGCSKSPPSVGLNDWRYPRAAIIRHCSLLFCRGNDRAALAGFCIGFQDTPLLPSDPAKRHLKRVSGD